MSVMHLRAIVPSQTTIKGTLMQSHAQIVIVGGGIMGVGLLYHLAEEGCSDALLIEKGELTSGSTWHAAGQCPSLVGNYNLAKIHAYSNDLYPRLEEMTGQYVSWHASGGIRLAREKEGSRLVQVFVRHFAERRIRDGDHRPRRNQENRAVHRYRRRYRRSLHDG